MNTDASLQRALQWALRMTRWITGQHAMHTRWLDEDDRSWTWAGPLNIGIALPHGWPTVLARTLEADIAAHADAAVIAATDGLARAHALPFDALSAPAGTRAIICTTGAHALTFAFAPDALAHLPPTAAEPVVITLGSAPEPSAEDQFLALPVPCPVVVELADGSFWHALLILSAAVPELQTLQRADAALEIRFHAMASELHDTLRTPVVLAATGSGPGTGMAARWMHNPADPAHWAVAVSGSVTSSPPSHAAPQGTFDPRD
jgi:hypothetical protein